MRGAEPTAGDVERLSSRTPDMPERQRYSAQNRCSARDHHGWAQIRPWTNKFVGKRASERATEQTNKNKKSKKYQSIHAYE
jgi:hypothetical protein